MYATRQRAINARHHCSGLSDSAAILDSFEAADRSPVTLRFPLCRPPALPPEAPSPVSPWGILRSTSALVQEAVSVGRPEHRTGRPARAHGGGNDRVRLVGFHVRGSPRAGPRPPSHHRIRVPAGLGLQVRPLVL